MAVTGTRANKRMQRELEKFTKDSTADGLIIEVKAEDCWNVKFSGAAGTIYEGDDFTLQVKCKDISLRDLLLSLLHSTY